jgi:hypothetical protein
LSVTLGDALAPAADDGDEPVLALQADSAIRATVAMASALRDRLCGA